MKTDKLSKLIEKDKELIDKYVKPHKFKMKLKNKEMIHLSLKLMEMTRRNICKKCKDKTCKKVK